MTTTCTGCGDYQSGDASGKCYECRSAEPGYRARLDAQVRAGMDAEYRAHPEWRQDRPQLAGPGPYRFFYADVIRKECPDCGRATAVGFDHAADPGAQTREPTSCTGCMAREIENGIRAEAEARNTYEVPDVPVPAPRAPEVTGTSQPELDELEISA